MTRGKRPAQANFYSRKKQKTSSQLHNKQSEEEDPASVIASSASTSDRITEVDKKEEEDDHSSSSSLSSPLRLVSLPHLVLINIVDNLSVTEVSRLSCVNKYLRDFINSHYILRVILTGAGTSSTCSDPDTLSASLNVLSADLRLSISQLPTDLFTYQPFARLNLRKLKSLRVTGQNHIWNKQYLLSDGYKNTIQELLSRPSYCHHLTHLEFLVDESKRSVDIVKLVRHFPNLVEVTLHGIGYFDTGSYHMDKDLAQNIISGLLYNSKIKILRLKSFDTLHRCIVIEERRHRIIILIIFFYKIFLNYIANLKYSVTFPCSRTLWRSCTLSLGNISRSVCFISRTSCTSAWRPPCGRAASTTPRMVN